MKLTPLDIKKQEFRRALRGFDTDEVEAFLEMVAEEYESTTRERNRLEEENLKLRTQLQDYQTLEKSLQQTLVNAQETVLHSRENSKREADMLVREAELHAERIIEEAKMRLAKLKNELLVVRAQKDSFARRLRHLLESQLELIGVLELDDLGFGESEKKAPLTGDTSAKSRLDRSAGAARPPMRQSGSATRAGEPHVVAAPEKAKAATAPSEEHPVEPRISDHFVT